MKDRNNAFYIKLREKIVKWAETRGFKEKKVFKYIISAPDFFYLLWKLSTDNEIPAEDRLLVGVALFYFISPFDLFPEGIMGPIGYLDDIAISAYVIKKIIKRAGEEKVKKYWLGEEDLLVSIENILETVDNYLGSGLWKKLVNLIESKEAKVKKTGKKESKKETVNKKAGKAKADNKSGRKTTKSADKKIKRGGGIKGKERGRKKTTKKMEGN